MPQRHRGPLPIPTSELVRIQGSLAPYGSTLWQGPAMRILVARVPDVDPDLVNDLETIVEGASPQAVEQAQGCIVLTPKNVHTVPLAPIRNLMEQRVASDRRQAERLRRELPGTLSYRLYRASDDPKRRLRLGVGLPKERVADLDDEDLEALADQLGATLEHGLPDLHCVHLVASRDHVRLSPDQFVPELVARWTDDARRLRLEAQQAADEAAAAQERERAKQRLRDELDATLERRQRVAVAPLRRVDAPLVEVDADLHAVAAPVPAPEGVHRAPPMVDGRRATFGTRRTVEEVQRAVDRMHVLDGTPATPASAVIDPTLDVLCAALDRNGYALRIQPRVPGHRIAVAAERSTPPRRLVVQVLDRLTPDAAQRALAAGRDLPVDEVLVVARQQDGAAVRSLVATKVRALRPDDLEGLVL